MNKALTPAQQRIAMRTNTLQHAATPCNTLQITATRCNTQWRIAMLFRPRALQISQ